MVDNIVKKPLGLILIVAAHMVLNVPSTAAVIGFLGANITLQFTFNVSLTNESRLSVNRGGNLSSHEKIDQYWPSHSNRRDYFYIDTKNNCVFWLKTNLKINDSGSYWASVFTVGLPGESEKVQLSVQEGGRPTTVPPMQTDIPMTTEDSRSLSHIVTVLVVSPVVLLVALLPWLIWCLFRTNDKQQPPPPTCSNSTIQETIETSKDVTSSSLVYSVLDFPKRPSAVLEINPSDTEYAAVSYLADGKRV